MSTITLEQAVELALARFNAGQLGEAEGICRQILAVDGRHGGVMNLMAGIAHQSGRLDVAIEWIRRAIAAHPSVAMFQGNLAELLRMVGKFEDAQTAAKAALALDPKSAGAWFTLGTAQLQGGRAMLAIESFERAIRLRPDHADSYNNLGSAFEAMDRLEDAIGAYRRAIELSPNDASPHNNLGVAYARLGQLDRAIACYSRAVDLHADGFRTHSHLIYTMMHDPAYDAPAIFQAHLEWAKRYAEPLSKFIQPHYNNRDADRRLTIGYVSPNFRAQAVAYFTEPIVAHHDHAKFSVICYHDYPLSDEVTQRFIAKADVWRNIVGLNDEQLAAQVRQDQVDILVDLSGHLPNHRLLMFARKPAPIQVTYIGYQTTTGMSAMDYRITDAVADPEWATDQYHTEKLVRLPVFFAYKALENGPGVGKLPAHRNGFVTFGSMNNFVKVGPGVIAVWAKILKEAPGSQLRILIAGGSKGNAHVLRAFEEQGVDVSRVILVPMGDVRTYLELFNQIDIALDPFPFSGHTTTCDALWMGVPVISLMGNMYAGRMAASVLTSLSLENWIAKDADEYVRIGVGLAGDVEELRKWRGGLREKLAASTAMDGAAFTRTLEDAYREMWKSYCERAN